MKKQTGWAALFLLACTALTTIWSTHHALAREAEKKTSESKATASHEQPQYIYPRVKSHGKVVHLPAAADQPRDDSKICVDITAAGSPEKINPAIEKVARFVNIYAGAGRKSARAHITVILHGSATLTALNNTAYARKFQTESNPNIPLFRKLKAAGVEFLVCGQAMIAKGGKHKDVTPEVQVAVSALTVNVNRQRDGYAFIPLH